MQVHNSAQSKPDSKMKLTGQKRETSQNHAMPCITVRCNILRRRQSNEDCLGTTAWGLCQKSLAKLCASLLLPAVGGPGMQPLQSFGGMLPMGQITEMTHQRDPKAIQRTTQWMIPMPAEGHMGHSVVSCHTQVVQG